MEIENHEYYISPDVAKLLEQAGFEWRCKYAYITTPVGDMPTDEDDLLTEYIENVNWLVKVPTLDVAQRWLREVKAIHICVKPNEASANCEYFVTVIVNDIKWGNVQDDNKKTIMFDTYEEAQEAGIKKALEIILEK